MGVQVGQILRQAARFSPDAIAVVDVGHPGAVRRELTFARLEQLARAVAAQLRAAGVERGDRVALLAENQAEVAAVWFGVVYAGAAIVPLNVLSTAREVAVRVQHAAAKLIVHDRARSSLAARALTAGCGGRALGLDELDYERDDRPGYPADTAPQDTAMVLYTSGTTGEPKGAAISHASLLLHTTLLVQHALGLGPDSRVLCTLPLSHSYGCRLAMLAPFYAGARVVVVPRFDAARTLQLMHDEGVTWLPGVPTMFAAWGQLPAADPPARLRWALCAGAPLGSEVARRAEARLGVLVRQGYGMTEATFATINAPPDERVLGSVGKPVWGVELRVIDESGRDVPVGQTGEVLVRGHNVMTHYLFEAPGRRGVADDGFIHSGDIGRLDEHGRLTVVDRIKDLVIRGGYNVYPSEVESALGEHPDVSAAAVIGRDDAFYGEEVVAVVVPRAGATLTAAELHAFLAERLSPTKLPREYAFVPELPLGPSGKIHKQTLRARLASGQLGSQQIERPRPEGPAQE